MVPNVTLCFPTAKGTRHLCAAALVTHPVLEVRTEGQPTTWSVQSTLRQCVSVCMCECVCVCVQDNPLVVTEDQRRNLKVLRAVSGGRLPPTPPLPQRLCLCRSLLQCTFIEVTTRLPQAEYSEKGVDGF